MLRYFMVSFFQIEFTVTVTVSAKLQFIYNVSNTGNILFTQCLFYIDGG